ncbi:hypothetical protein, partial [Adlercreutzia sp.]|uniref:hypothetical protein n=1 Tax=Adlercreutzia sp. TaxID=1872387 RepID=UPI003FD7FA27
DPYAGSGAGGSGPARLRIGGGRLTNWERYFGSPEAAMRMGVRMMTWPLLIVVDEVDPHTRCAKHSRRVGEFASFEEYAAWLHAEYDDGTIRWDE